MNKLIHIGFFLFTIFSVLVTTLCNSDIMLLVNVIPFMAGIFFLAIDAVEMNGSTKHFIVLFGVTMISSALILLEKTTILPALGIAMLITSFAIIAYIGWCTIIGISIAVMLGKEKQKNEKVR